jgi:hypothetical protein
MRTSARAKSVKSSIWTRRSPRKSYVANSPLFGVAREISTVKHAVSLVRLNRIKAMATIIALSTVVKSWLRIEILRKFWRHSLVTAVLTDESARAAGARVDGAYTMRSPKGRRTSSAWSKSAGDWRTSRVMHRFLPIKNSRMRNWSPWFLWIQNPGSPRAWNGSPTKSVRA